MTTQRTIFDGQDFVVEPKKVNTSLVAQEWQLYVDGAARNNPGPAGAGIYITKEGKSIVEKGHFLGTRTNNQAEYLALLLGLYYLQELSITEPVHIISDSQLLISQVCGVYKIKNHQLQQLHAIARSMLAHMKYTCSHVLREYNLQADALANKGIDKKIPVPISFVAFIESNGFTW